MSLPPAQRAPVPRAPLMLGLALFLLVTAALPAVAAGIDRLLAEPAPLVLKDGRIARVSVFAVRFPTGSAELDADTERALETLLDDEATDCFLTAQAIGHAEAPAADAGDTLAEHRLARARADRVQQVMVDRGLAATAIASVWDWQFVVKEPRVTLWIFDLPTGSDCKGRRLERPRPVASAAPEAEAAAAPEAEATAAAAQSARPSPPSAPSSSPAAPGGAVQPPAPPVASQPSEPASPSPPASEQTATSEPPPPPVAPSSPTTSTPITAPAEETPAATEPPPEPASSAPATPTTTQKGATSEETPPTEAEGPQKAPEESAASAPDAAPPAPPDAAPPQPAPAAAHEPSSAKTASVPFDVNSSFLSKAAIEKLRGIAGLARSGERFTIELTASVGGEVKDASGQQAADRYNHWMAERRIGRVTDWLRQNSGSATLEFKSGFVTRSGSPQVEVKLGPAG